MDAALQIRASSGGTKKTSTSRFTANQASSPFTAASATKQSIEYQNSAVLAEAAPATSMTANTLNGISGVMSQSDENVNILGNSQ